MLGKKCMCTNMLINNQKDGEIFGLSYAYDGNLVNQLAYSEEYEDYVKLRNEMPKDL